MPTDDGNALEPTATANAPSLPDLTALTPEQIEAHPHVQELKKKYSAAHSGMDKANLTKKQLEAELAKYKTLAGEQEPEPEEEKPSFVTKEELSASLWEAQNAKDIELYADDQYKQELDMGVPKPVALQYAKLRAQKNPNSAQVARQQAMASPGASSTRDLEDVEITDEDRADAATWGYSLETVKKQKQMKRARG